jgi:uncharacterized membrane protein
MELITIIILTFVTAPVVELTDGVPRIILGTIFLLFFPGYTLIAALFPRKDSMQGVERVALTFVLSFALVALTGLILNYTPWEIRLTPIFVAIAIMVISFSAIAFYRRKLLPADARFEPRIHIKMPQWGKASRLDKALSIGLVIAVIGAIGTLAYVIAEPKNEEAFTDFYMLGPEGMMENYPREIVLGGQAEITLGIKNHENAVTDYNIQVTIDGKICQTIGPISLKDEEEWRQKIALVPVKVGDNQEVEFLLFKGEEVEPYLKLHLWLDVKEKP